MTVFLVVSGVFWMCGTRSQGPGAAPAAQRSAAQRSAARTNGLEAGEDGAILTPSRDRPSAPNVAPAANCMCSRLSKSGVWAADRPATEHDFPFVFHFHVDGEGSGLALVNLSVVERRYRAVLAVERSTSKIVVAAQLGFTPNALHT